MASMEYSRGAAAERNRIRTIIRSPAAQGRLAAAVDLALDTDLSTEAACGLLAAAAAGLEGSFSGRPTQAAIDKSWEDANTRAGWTKPSD